MSPNFLFDHSQFPEFNTFQDYNHADVDNYHQIMPAADVQQLPPLEDANHTTNDHSYHNNHNPLPFSFQVQDSGHHDQNPNSISEPNKPIHEKLTADSKSPASLELLSSYRSKFKLPGEVCVDEREPDCDEKLSTVDIIKLAAEKFIRFSTQRVNGYTMFTHPYGSSAFTRLSIDQAREVELVFQLLTAAERAGRRQFDIASKFLTRCGWVACDRGSPVERLVYYLCEALRKKIGIETGIPMPTKLEKPGLKNENPSLAKGTNPAFLACHQVLPFNQVLQFSGIQAIIDQIGTSSKIHLIDIHIRSGVQWTSMIQALAERKSQIELLKITAFAKPSDVQKVGETGKRLENFATALSLPFSFKILVLSDITEVKQEQLQVQDGECVAVYCQTILRTMISQPQSLENLMKAIRTINPCAVVVAEVESNHNSTSFVNRFTETLFFYGAYFDCLDVCMSRDDAHRAVVEGVHLADGMQNTVAAEGEDRVSRSVNMSTWRLFFSRFGMVEIELSDSCVYQANLVLQQFSCASSCMLENDGNSLIIGWKGTPLHSLSTWKFVQQ